jgi:hypothetical protein
MKSGNEIWSMASAAMDEADSCMKATDTFDCRDKEIEEVREYWYGVIDALLWVVEGSNDFIDELFDKIKRKGDEDDGTV